jgi:hypothetical protein
MSYRFTGLSPETFRPLFGLPDAALAEHAAKRLTVQQKPFAPDRITLDDAEPGETVLLVHYEHQPANTPYRASHAVFVRETANEAATFIDAIPPSLRFRVISLRAFDAGHQMIDADIADGAKLDELVERLFANPDAAYLHAHYAKRGCYAARVDRA